MKRGMVDEVGGEAFCGMGSMLDGAGCSLAGGFHNSMEIIGLEEGQWTGYR